MTTKQKMSLKEFIDDTRFGESWADDDFDPSSISVPTFHPRHNDGFNQSHMSPFNSGGFNQNFQHSQFRGSSYPEDERLRQFFIKFLDVPSYFGVEDMEDLFHSRFTKFVKLKLFWEIDFQGLRYASDPIEAIDMTRKVCYVEVESLDIFTKVLKWHDLYVNRGKIIPERGSFDDLRTYHELNRLLPEEDDPNLSGSARRSIKQTHHHSQDQHRQDHQHQDQSSQQQYAHHDFPPHHQPEPVYAGHLHQHRDAPRELPPLHVPSPAPTPRRVNPFGSAKPVDTLSRERELQKKMQGLEINKTTFRTLGSLEREKRHSESHQGYQNPKDHQSETSEVKHSKHSTEDKTSLNNNANVLKPAPQPTSVWGSPQSYAQVTSPPKSSFTVDLSKNSSKKDEKDKVKGKVILKRKIKKETDKQQIVAPSSFDEGQPKTEGAPDDATVINDPKIVKARGVTDNVKKQIQRELKKTDVEPNSKVSPADSKPSPVKFVENGDVSESLPVVHNGYNTRGRLSGKTHARGRGRGRGRGGLRRGSDTAEQHLNKVPEPVKDKEAVNEIKKEHKKGKDSKPEYVETELEPKKEVKKEARKEAKKETKKNVIKLQNDEKQMPKVELKEETTEQSNTFTQSSSESKQTAEPSDSIDNANQSREAFAHGIDGSRGRGRGRGRGYHGGRGRGRGRGSRGSVRGHFRNQSKTFHKEDAHGGDV
ncbi:KLTH0G04290p [Cyberlindnera jadinii]|uniref:KLTH0G04290p n=1 Tax=Cyberlindnera jadinii (strain ATCC 18201 / CBS 1600 / BCRC 20928 / JCM 3617 / NBRC 0987 / NRRL Y-1542) TaxID=983966 RepID=A0A0H5C0U6_CYBJN|nr:KLTH0G04290p [Cyberlindnera jadinii]